MSINILWRNHTRDSLHTIFILPVTLMMTITLLAKKGGVGKSTVRVLLHEAFKKAGKSVAIQDWDAQGTSNKALAFLDGSRAEHGRTYDVLLIDTPPNLEHPATDAAVRSPTSQSSTDAKARDRWHEPRSTPASSSRISTSQSTLGCGGGGS